MAKITWHGEGKEGPKSITWAGKEFKIGEAVEVDDPKMLAKAKGNRFFKTEGEIRAEIEPALVPPPSQVSAQYPVPKGGEPVSTRPGPSPAEQKSEPTETVRPIGVSSRLGRK